MNAIERLKELVAEGNPLVLLKAYEADQLLTYIKRLEQQNDDRNNRMIHDYINNQNYIVKVIIAYIEEEANVSKQCSMYLAQELRQKFLTENEEE